MNSNTNTVIRSHAATRVIRARELARNLHAASGDKLWYDKTPEGRRRAFAPSARAFRLTAFANRIDA